MGEGRIIGEGGIIVGGVIIGGEQEYLRRNKIVCGSRDERKQSQRRLSSQSTRRKEATNSSPRGLRLGVAFSAPNWG